MKKILLLLNMVFMSTIIGCNHLVIPPLGKMPTEPFSVNSFLENGAVFEQKDILSISGLSDPGVVIELQLIDYRQNIVNQAYTTTLDNGEWVINFTTPKGSYRPYTVKISDGRKIYEESFSNVYFGKLWLLAGSEVVDKKVAIDTTELNNLYFYHNSKEQSEWLDKEQITELPELALLYSKKLNEVYDMPVGVIITTMESSFIGEWLNVDTIENDKRIQSFFDFCETYNIAENYQKGIIFDQCFKKLKGISICQLVFSDDSQLLASLNDDIGIKYLSQYGLILDAIVKDWFSLFGNNLKIGLLQYSSKPMKFASELRYCQSRITNYYKYTYLIPTYDLNKILIEDENTIIEDVDFNILVHRISGILDKQYEVSGYANLIKETNSDRVITKIIIEFLPTTILSKVSNIEYLEIFDQDGNLIDATVEISKNRIIIYTSYTEEIIDQDTRLSSSENQPIIKYYDIGMICYAMAISPIDCNLYNQHDVPIVPFKITL